LLAEHCKVQKAKHRWRSVWVWNPGRPRPKFRPIRAQCGYPHQTSSKQNGDFSQSTLSFLNRIVLLLECIQFTIWLSEDQCSIASWGLPNYLLFDSERLSRTITLVILSQIMPLYTQVWNSFKAAVCWQISADNSTVMFLFLSNPLTYFDTKCLEASRKYYSCSSKSFSWCNAVSRIGGLKISARRLIYLASSLSQIISPLFRSKVKP